LIISFIFHFFDDWDGETAKFVVDGELVWDQSYRWCEKVFCFIVKEDLCFL
jgi:hypothetical protein